MPEFYSVPNKHDILENHKRIQSFIHETPVHTSQEIDRIAGCEVFMKCENFQKTGSFKFRGAITACLHLNDFEKSKGVATHSSGNHGQALAKAAQILGINAYIVMPENAPKVKVQAVKSYGAEVIFCAPTLSAREDTLAQVLQKNQATEIHPYNNYSVILGQASCAKELIEQTQNLDFIVPPVGGGGLCSGSILSAKYFTESIKVVGAEPQQADDAFQSWKSGKLIPQTNPDTIADGLRTSLGDKTFPIINEGIERIFTVREETIVKALQLIWERMKIVIEPSCAVPLATVLEHPDYFENKRVGLILTGGNVDVKVIADLF